MWACVFSVDPFPSWWLREYTYLSCYHHQIGSMNYYPLFRVRSWNNGMRCMSIFFWLSDYTHSPWIQPDQPWTNCDTMFLSSSSNTSSRLLPRPTCASKLSLRSTYRITSNISGTLVGNKIVDHSVKDSRTVLWLALPNPLKPDVKSRMKM